MKALPIRIFVASLLAASPSLADPAPPAVAVVAALDGPATVSSGAGAERRPLRLFDWLPAGALIEISAEARTILAFADGARVELAGGTKARLTAQGARASVGRVLPLTSVPPMPRLPPLIDTGADGRASAVRIRQGGRVRGLYPRGGATVLHDNATLSFSSADAATHRLEIEDETGRRVFEAETQSAVVPVPPGILAPGSRYYWRIRTVEVGGPPRRGEAEFATLDAQTIRERAALRAALLPSGEPASLGLLAEVDRRLGLLGEALDGLRAARAVLSDDPGLREALERLEQELAEEPQ